MGIQTDYAEQLLEAMKIISKAQTDAVSFDSTIQCTIVDDRDAAQGVYTVNNGSANFIAYSSNTDYKTKDVVIVTIPQGDYNQQKIIIGKYIAKNSTPFVFKNPFDYFLDITGNIASNSKGEWSILANNIPQDVICPEGPVAHWTSTNTEDVPLAGFDTLGIKAEFLAQLSGFHVVSGNYGLKITVKALKSSSSTEEGAAATAAYDTTENVTVDETTSQYLTEKTFFLSVDDMYGDPYDFDTYYTQQAIFDISDLGAIVDIRVDLFQGVEEIPIEGLENEYDYIGTFKDKTGNLIACKDETFDEIYMDNIYVKDVYLALGYNESQFDTDKLILYTKNNNHYSSTQTNVINEKILFARWIHKNENGEIVIINDLNEVSGATLKWFQFKLNSPATDEYAGLQWATVEAGNILAADFTTEPICKVDASNIFKCALVPNTELAQEQIKVIVTYNNKILRSNILTFTNEREVLNPLNTAQYEDFYIIATDSSEGVYNIYGNDNKIIEETYDLNGGESKETASASRRLRKLSPRFQGAELSDIEYIKWTIPAGYTMIHPVTSKNEPLYEIVNGQPIYTSWLVGTTENWSWSYGKIENSVEIEFPNATLDRNGYLTPSYNDAELNEKYDLSQFDWNFYYTIDDTFNQINTNNTIICEIVKDRIHYQASFEMFFGHANTNGSPYTLAVTFQPIEPNKPVEYALQAKPNSKVKLCLTIFDENNKRLDWKNASLLGDAVVKWEWLYAVNNSTPKEDTYEEVDHANIPLFRQAQSSGGIYDPYEDRNTRSISSINKDSNNANLSPTYYTKTGNVYSAATGWYNEGTTYYIKHIGFQANWGGQHANAVHVVFKEDEDDATADRLYVERRGLDPLKNIVYLQTTAAITINEVYAVKVTVSNFLPYDLISYVPIPLYLKRDEDRYKPLFIGPGYVWYNSKGDVDFYKNPCRLEWIDLQNDNAAVVTPRETYVDFEIYDPLASEGPRLESYSTLQTTAPPLYVLTEDETYVAGKTYYSYNSGTKLYSVINNWTAGAIILTPNNTYEKLTKYTLQPLAFYLDEWTPHGVRCSYEGETYWMQPIVYYQNAYPNGTINEWDGNGVTINEEEGTILSNVVVAGKKETDNTFTGVMLGDLQHFENVETNLTETTGVYGFHHGTQSYALKDDGTAFIGKSGRGRIYLDGNHSIITSSEFLKNHPYYSSTGYIPAESNAFRVSATTPSNGYGVGVRIDLDSSPYIYVRGFSTNIHNDQHIRDIIYIGDADSENYIQSASFTDLDADAGLKLDLNHGRLEAFGNFEIDAKATRNSYSPLYLSNNGDALHGYLNIKDNASHYLVRFANDEQYLQSIGYNPLDSTSQGVRLDLHNGYLKANGTFTLEATNPVGNQNQIVRLSTESPYLVIDGKNGNTVNHLLRLADVGDNDNTNSSAYIQSYGFTQEVIGSNGLTTTNGVGMRINLDPNDPGITAYKFYLKAGSNPNYIMMTSDVTNSTYALQIGDFRSTAIDLIDDRTYQNKVFKVDWNGQVTATTARLGGWYFWEGNEQNPPPKQNGTYTSGSWRSMYSYTTAQSADPSNEQQIGNAGRYYTIFDATRQNVIAVGLPEEWAFQNHHYANFRVMNTGEMYTTAAHLGYIPSEPGSGWLATQGYIQSNGSSVVMTFDPSTGEITESEGNETVENSNFRLDTKDFERPISGFGPLPYLRLAISNNFAVNKNGVLYCNGARLKNLQVSGNGRIQLGNWTITPSRLQNSNSYWDASTGSLHIGSDTMAATLSINGAVFSKAAGYCDLNTDFSVHGALLVYGGRDNNLGIQTYGDVQLLGSSNCLQMGTGDYARMSVSQFQILQQFAAGLSGKFGLWAGEVYAFAGYAYFA